MDWTMILLIGALVVCCGAWHWISTMEFYPEYDEREYGPAPLKPWEEE